MTTTGNGKARVGGGMLVMGLALAGALISPLAVYLFGSTLMGPYEGEGGLAGFLGSVYEGVFQARPGALALVLSPAAFVSLWWLIGRLLRSSRPRDPEKRA